MKTIALAFSLLLLAAAGQARNMGPVASAARWAGERDPFYCQQPGEDRWWAYNAMSYYQTEMADDIPRNLNGKLIRQVILYVSEWDCASWWDPQGLVVNFYNQACPPAMTPSIHFEIPWSALQVEVVQNSGPPFWYVRKVTAQLPNAVTIASPMSIGGYAVENWSYDQHGWAGLVITSANVVTGCELYVDDAFQGYPRWTPGSLCNWSYGIPADLAYCLIVDEPTAVRSMTWGRVRSLFR